MVERHQKLATYYDIQFDSSKLECDVFSCIPVDVSVAGGATACSFSESYASEFPLYDETGKVLRKMTACGKGCYAFRKSRNPTTGEPVAVGNMLTPTVGKKGEKMCGYLNQRLILWAGVPNTRQPQGTVDDKGDVVNNRPYELSDIPPFAFKALNRLLQISKVRLELRPSSLI